MTHLIEILQGLDTIWVFVVVCSCMVTLTAAMPWLRHGLLRLEVGRPVSDGASDALKAVTGFMVFVVAFSLVQVQGQFRTAEDMALKEATAISTMDRALFHFGTPASLAGRLDLLAYAGSVVTDEWPLLARNQRSVKTDALFKKFAADVRLLEGETSRQRAAEGEMLRTLDNMEDMREARIAAAEFGLMPLFWGGVRAVRHHPRPGLLHLGIDRQDPGQLRHDLRHRHDAVARPGVRGPVCRRHQRDARRPQASDPGRDGALSRPLPRHGAGFSP